jgi:hypothetical protein
MLRPRGGNPRERQPAGRASRPAASRVSRRGGAAGRAGSGSVKINGRSGSSPRGRCRRGLQVAGREGEGPYSSRWHVKRRAGGPGVSGALKSTAERGGHGLGCGCRRRMGRGLDEQGRPGACTVGASRGRGSGALGITRSAGGARAPHAHRGGSEKGAGVPRRRGSRKEPGSLVEAALSPEGVPAVAGRPAKLTRASIHSRGCGDRRRIDRAQQGEARRAGTACRGPP